MKVIDKRLIMKVTAGTVTDRMHVALNTAKQNNTMAEKLRNWTAAGFLLGELGAAVLETWLALDKNGDLDNLTKDEKAAVLVDLLAMRKNIASNERKKEEVKPVTAKPPESKTAAAGLKSLTTKFQDNVV